MLIANDFQSLLVTSNFPHRMYVYDILHSVAHIVLTKVQTQTFRPLMSITFNRTLPYPLPQRSSVGIVDLSFRINARSFLFVDAQLHPASPHPISPIRQVADEVTPLLDSRPSEPTARPPHRHTVTGTPPHNLVLGHHRYEPHQQHERHHSDHPRCGLAQFYGPEDREEEDAAANKIAQTRDYHAAEHRQSRHRHSHSHHSHGDIETFLDDPDTDAETDSTADEAELKIGRKRQIIGILV